MTSTSRHHTEDAAASSSPFLGKEVRVEIGDGRIAVGVLLAHLGSGDVLLQRVLEQRRMKDGLVVIRRLNLLAIPFKHIKTIHRRKDDSITPLYTQFEEEAAAEQTAA